MISMCQASTTLSHGCLHYGSQLALWQAHLNTRRNHVQLHYIWVQVAVDHKGFMVVVLPWLILSLDAYSCVPHLDVQCVGLVFPDKSTVQHERASHDDYDEGQDAGQGDPAGNGHCAAIGSGGVHQY